MTPELYGPVIRDCEALAKAMDDDDHLKLAVLVLSESLQLRLRRAEEEAGERAARRDDLHERIEMRMEWRATETYAEILEAWRPVPIRRSFANLFADLGIDPEAARNRSDADLLATIRAEMPNHQRPGAVTFGKLRAYFEADD